MKDEDYQYQQQLYKEYVDQRNETNRFALEVGARYEKLLSLVAGGALVVSLTFIEKIAPHPSEYTKWAILAAWILLGVGIISSLIAIYQSQNALQKKIENLDTEISQKLNPENEELKKLDATSNPHIETVRTANKWSLYSTLGGLFFLILFAFLNFPSSTTKEQNEERPKEESPAPTAKGTNTNNQGGGLHPDNEPSSTSQTQKIEISHVRGKEKNTTSEADADDSGIIHSNSESGQPPEATTKGREEE
jgi:cell division protein FtsL